MEADEVEREQEGREKSDSSKEEEAKRDQELSPKPKEGSMRSDNQKAIHYEKSTPENQSSKYKSTDYSSSPNQHHHYIQKEDTKNISSQVKIEEMKSAGNTGSGDYKQTEHNEPIQARKNQEHTIEQTSKHDERRPAHGSYEQKSEKEKMLRKQKMQYDEDRAAEVRRHQEDVLSHQTMSM